jgi:hypothetical protein
MFRRVDHYPDGFVRLIGLILIFSALFITNLASNFVKMIRYFIALSLVCSQFLSGQILSPEAFLGYPIGTEYSRHHQMVEYFQHLASQSDWISFHEYGKTNERRSLNYAIITSPDNHARLEQIRQDNLKQIGKIPGDANPEYAIVWLSYNVHGNEASSMEAAMQTAYTLISTQSPWLKNTVVIIDPCVNPDGRDRYANWYNQVGTQPYNPLQSADEHNEPWPGGRPNHYLFDLNRDWAWAKQVESRQRLPLYHRWMPHVHVDFHEQGINEPYYFAPAAVPYHEVITDWQKEFQVQIGRNNAKYFDQEGWLYFTRQFFDLLYPSYGDTYPTYLGAIGMTYEQAGNGRAGLGILNDEGVELTLVDRVAHHTTTGLSTIEISSKNAVKLNREFKTYFTAPQALQNYILQGNPDKIRALMTLLDRHEIQYSFATASVIKGWDYKSQKNVQRNIAGALVVSTDQVQGAMVKVLFEADAALEDPLTYDITAWSLPYAFGLNCLVTDKTVVSNQNNPYGQSHVLPGRPSVIAGYVAPWGDVIDATFLTDLLKKGIRVRFSEKPLSFEGKAFPRGSLVITKGDNVRRKDFNQLVEATAADHHRVLSPLSSGFSDNGVDLGSTDIKLINPHRIAVLKGDGVSSLSYGTIWHFMEQELNYQFTPINTHDFSVSRLSEFDILVMPSGHYSDMWDKEQLNALNHWVRQGGKVIAIDQAVNVFVDREGFGLKSKRSETQEENNMVPYGDRERHSVKDLITGSIYKVHLDPSHPLAFGYSDTYFSLKQDDDAYLKLDRGYNVGYFQGAATSYSGFSGKDAQEKLNDSFVFGEVPNGQGSMVYLTDDVLFRSFWENGKMFFVNSLFMVDANVFVLD